MNAYQTQTCHWGRATLILVFLFSVGNALALDKKTILRKLEASQAVKESYSAKIHSKLMMANHVINDSGRIDVLAPNCQKMIWSSLTQSTCGDTTWTRSPSGDVTRSIGSNAAAMPGLGGKILGLFPLPGQSGSSAGSASDTLGAMAILPATDSGTIKLRLGDPDSEMGTVVVVIDTTDWLPVKATSQQPGNPEIETGFRYTKWKGKRLMSEIRMVIPNGFMIFEVSDFQPAKGLRRKSFQLL